MSAANEEPAIEGSVIEKSAVEEPEFAASDEGLAHRRDRRFDKGLFGESFMATFAAIGALLLVDPRAADAALPDSASPRPPGEAADPLRGALAPAEDQTLGPPAAADSAFLEAMLALGPPSILTGDLPSSIAGAASPDPVAPPDDTPSGPPDEADNDAQYSLPGSLAVIGSAQALVQFADAKRLSEADNDMVFSLANDTVGAFSGGALPGLSAAAPTAAARIALAGDGAQPFGHATQGSGFDDALVAQARAPGAGVSVAVSGASGQVAASSENAPLAAGGNAAFASATSALVAEIVDLVEQSELSAFGAGYPGANDNGAFILFAEPTPVAPFGGDRLGFAGADAPPLAGLPNVEVAAASHVRLT